MPRLVRFHPLLLCAALLACAVLPAGVWAQTRAPERRQVLGYYVPWDGASWATLEANAGQLDVVAAQWVTVDACGRLSSREDQTLKQFARGRGIRIAPSLLTLSGGLNTQLLTDPEIRATLLDEIVAYTRDEQYDGFDLDLEGVAAGDREAYTGFVAELADRLHARGKFLSLAIPPKERDVTVGWAGAFDYAALGQLADLITVMAYEYRGPFSGPGSVAPYDWVERVAAFASREMPAHKVLLGLAFYGYDWNTTSGGTRSLTHRQAAALANYYGAEAQFDGDQRSVTFGYVADGAAAPPAAAVTPLPAHDFVTRTAPPCPLDQPRPTPVPRPGPGPGPQQHEVWIEESASAAARLALAERYGTGGVATWRLGQEDPNVWPLFASWRGR
jgi:spore germination protein YaaH